MSKTRYSKKEYKRKVARLREKRENTARESGITSLSTYEQYLGEIHETRSQMSRHPGGTKAEGLRKDYNGWQKVSFDRVRFGEAECLSSRMRRTRRAVLHAARLKRKKELAALLEEVEKNKI